MDAICTVADKNHLWRVRVLEKSVKKHHPDIDFRILLTSDAFPDNRYDVPAQFLSPKELSDMDARYNVFERTLACRPPYVAWLLQTYDRVISLDSDTLLFRPLDELWEAVSHSSMVLTPHLTSPVPLENRLNEIYMLKAGVFNGGVFGFRRCEEARNILRWWSDRTSTHCLHDRGEKAVLFLDQKWMEYIPCYFDGVRVFRNPAYNVAYWNWKQRSLKYDSGKFSVCEGGAEIPLALFHFSGYELSSPWTLSKWDGVRDTEPALVQVLKLYYDACASQKRVSKVQIFQRKRRDAH
jgi:hypothetical protein